MRSILHRAALALGPTLVLASSQPALAQSEDPAPAEPPATAQEQQPPVREQAPIAVPRRQPMAMPQQPPMAMLQQPPMAMPQQPPMAMPQQPPLVMPRRTPLPMPQLPGGAAEIPVSPAPRTERAEGTLTRHPWAKTLESFSAGGSDFFTLESGRPDVMGGRSSSTRLLPSAKVTKERLLKLVGKRVRVTGLVVPGRPFIPEPGSQYPVDADGNPAVKTVGGGLEVQTIELLPTARPGK